MEEGSQDLMLATSKKEEQDEAYLKSLPDGYHFKPRDEELVDTYMRKKVNIVPLPGNRIKEVQLCRHDPEIRRNLNQSRSIPMAESPDEEPERATDADKPVKCKGKLVGFKKTLVFYKGKPPHGTKTNCIMHEYVLNGPPAIQRTRDNDMQLDKWVLCRVYKKHKDADSKAETPKQCADQEDGDGEDSIFGGQTDAQNQGSSIQPQAEAQNHQEHEILPQTETQNQGYWIQLETQNLGNWILHPEPVQQFQVLNFHTLRTFTNSLPNATILQQCISEFYISTTSTVSWIFDPRLNHDHSTMFSQQAAVSGYGSLDQPLHHYHLFLLLLLMISSISWATTISTSISS